MSGSDVTNRIECTVHMPTPWGGRCKSVRSVMVTRAIVVGPVGIEPTT